MCVDRRQWKDFVVKERLSIVSMIQQELQLKDVNDTFRTIIEKRASRSVCKMRSNRDPYQCVRSWCVWNTSSLDLIQTWSQMIMNVNINVLITLFSQKFWGKAVSPRVERVRYDEWAIKGRTRHVWQWLCEQRFDRNDYKMFDVRTESSCGSRDDVFNLCRTW